MRIFGRRLSNWWLVPVGAIVVIGSPVLLLGLFAANNLAGAIFGPPAIWNRTMHTPHREDVVGDYVEVQRRLDRDMGIVTARISLHEEGTFDVAGLPMDEYPAYCVLTGAGRWGLWNNDGVQVDLNVLSVSSHSTCKSGDYTYVELSGHSKPYEMYWVVGDPDSGNGIWLAKER